MDGNRYLQELCRKIVPLNLSVDGPRKNGDIYFNFKDMPICHVTINGVCSYFPEHLDTEEKKELYNFVAEISEETRIYVQAVEKAPMLKAADLRDGYKLLCEHENIVLAGKDMGEHGFQFVTWQYTYDRKGVTLGHYYHNDYAGAKEDFTIRSCLIDKHKLFEPEEIKEIYRALDYCTKYLTNLTYDEEHQMMGLKEKLERTAPNVVEAYRAELVDLQGSESDEFSADETQDNALCEDNHGPLLSM